MHEQKKTWARLSGSATVSEGHFPNRIHLPESVYEALPAAYMAIGSLFVAGAAYLGIAVPSAVGYLALGLLCIAAGFRVHGIRRRERSK